ncbi:MAG: spore cortex biosynthesis protein YabQ [Clostridia bacterium]|nr:spore cortex biosynthesis protein YabQ [Clostridia bacterium]
MQLYSQEQIFIFFFIIGVVLGIVFDFFRVIRKSFKISDFSTLIQDIIFLVFSGMLIITSIIKLNGGEVRLFLFLGIFFGALIYLLTISDLCVIIFLVFVKICKKILKIPYKCYKNIIKLNKQKEKKDF